MEKYVHLVIIWAIHGEHSVVEGMVFAEELVQFCEYVDDFLSSHWRDIGESEYVADAGPTDEAVFRVVFWTDWFQD